MYKHMLKVLYTISVHNVVVKIAPHLNQPMFQFLNAVDICLLNTFLYGCPYPKVNRVEL